MPSESNNQRADLNGTDSALPQFQRAIQLVGPEQLVLNESKPVILPGPHQILGRVEAVGLCFSDLKLLKQFSHHPRKSEIVAGIEPALLRTLHFYVPGEAPTVLGHEVVVRISRVGDSVRGVTPGARYLVQTDYRWLPTAGANAAFGYNFEGALQEYVLMDECVITSPEGESMLIPAPEELSAAAIALIEPWACVESAYASPERQSLRPGGSLLVVADREPPRNALRELFESYGRPAAITWVSSLGAPKEDLRPKPEFVSNLAQAPDGAYDDIIYFGSDAQCVESLFTKASAHALVNVVLSGEKLGRPVAVPIGRVHYTGLRIIGTPGINPEEAMRLLPESGEIRPGDAVNIIGAGGPLGTMHVIRSICLGRPRVAVFGGDLDSTRLARLAAIATPLAQSTGASFTPYDPRQSSPRNEYDYQTVMAPVPALAAEAVVTTSKGGIINVFAGIPIEVTVPMNLDQYIEKGLYLIGTSGSNTGDMRAVLDRVQTGRLNTNLSLAAVAGLDGAIEGLQAVQANRVAGKIVVFPSCRGLGLEELGGLASRFPEVAALLDSGVWTAAAERALLRRCAHA